MRKLFLIARSNLRKGKGQTVAIVVLILIAALMLNLWLMLSMDYKQNFRRYHDKLNAEHVTLAVGEGGEEFRGFLKDTLDKDTRTEEYSIDDALIFVGTFDYNGGEMNAPLVYLKKETALSRTVGKVEITEQGNQNSGIYVPMIYKSDDIDIGKTITFTFAKNKIDFTVCGFINSVMAGSHNCGMCEFVLTEDEYARFEDTGIIKESTLCSVRIDSAKNSESFEAMLCDAFTAQYSGVYYASNSYELVSSSRYVSQMVSSAILSAMAFLVLFIVLVVISSNIVNYVQTNLKNLGALKAVGYTSTQLICSLLLQFLGLTLIAAIVGTGLSYCLFPALNSMMVAQTGIPYKMRFLPLPILISLLIIGGTVALVVWLSARRVRKIEPIVALRSGISTHNFKRNNVPLDRTKVSLNFALALKTTLSGFKHNITVCITMLVLSLVVVMSGVMTRNVIADVKPFIDLIAGESTDSCINIDVDVEDEFLAEMNADTRVEKIYLYNSTSVRHVDGLTLLATMCDDFDKVNVPSVVYKGRFPKYDNEIAIAAKYAKDNGIKIGDEIKLTAEGVEADYIVTGFTQVTNDLGKDCLLTREGYERMGNLSYVSYYIDIVEGVDIDAFNAEVRDKYADYINVALNVDSVISSGSKIYVSLVKIIVIAILFISAIIIAFVLYLLVRTMLNNKNRDYGILKALGFTSRQLIVQTALSFMPAVIISTVVGLVISSLVINPLLSLFLSSIGILKCTFIVPVGLIAGMGVGLMLLAFGIACLMSLKIRNISPHKLLVGE